MEAFQNIFLTGFMGCGKSTHGKKLAQLLNMEFIDLDKFIESKEKQTITAIFEKDGEDAFRQTETKCLKELLGMAGSHVVSLGGGTICFNDNLNLVKQNGLLIYIQMPAAALFARVAHTAQQRPLLKGHSGEELKYFIEQKLEERKPFYESAHLKVNGISLTVAQLQLQISEFNKKNSH